MRLKPILFFAVVGVIAGLFVYREATRDGAPGMVTIGQQAPDITVKDENGKLVKLSDFRGKLVLVNFWATWCGPCVEEAPQLNNIAHRLKDQNFQMMAVSIDTDWDAVTAFHKRLNIDMPTFWDPGQHANRAFKTTGQPETFIISPNGTVLSHYWFPPNGWPAMSDWLESKLKEFQTTQTSPPTVG